MDPLKKIVWLASYPKSGNTWLRVLLSNFLSDQDTPININELPEKKIASDRQLIDEVSGINTSDLSFDEVEVLRPRVYREIALKSTEPVFLKVHDAWTLNAEGNPLFEKEVTRAVIYIIRHPLDVAISFAHHNDIDPESALNRLMNNELSLCGHPDKLYNQCRQKLLTWREHAESWLDTSGLPVHLLKYEDLLENTELAFSKVLDFLDIPYSSSQIQRTVEFSSFKTLEEQEKENGFKEKPIKSSSFFNKGSSNNWQGLIDIKKAAYFMEQNELINKRYGYTHE